MQRLPKKSSARKKSIPLDGDKLGMIGGMIGAIIVLFISLFAHKGEMLTTVIRVGWAFVICYGGTFFLVRMILRTTLLDLLEQEKATASAAKDAPKDVPE
jgi:hypothetical protein